MCLFIPISDCWIASRSLQGRGVRLISSRCDLIGLRIWCVFCGSCCISGVHLRVRRVHFQQLLDLGGRCLGVYRGKAMKRMMKQDVPT